MAIRDHVDKLPTSNSDITEEEYQKIKFDKGHFLHGYCAYQLSYGGKRWGGYRRDKAGKRDYISEGYRNAVKQSPKLQGLQLFLSNYQRLIIPEGSIIYCDPPYKNTTKYKTDFDHDLFWDWCRVKTTEGHSVFVSEYTAPADFICVWQKEINSSLTKNTGSKKGFERLFVHESQIK